MVAIVTPPPPRALTIALTGGTGFLGHHVMACLIRRGHHVQALTRKARSEQPGTTWIAGDLQTPKALDRLVAGADAVIHVAGVVNAPDAAGFDQGNRLGTLAILGATQAAGVDRFVHVSSLAAREPGLSVYGASKRAAEDAVTASPLNWAVVRPPAIYGPGDLEMLDLFRMARLGFVALPPTQTMSIIHARDLATLLAILAETDGRCSLDADDGHAGGWPAIAFARAIGGAVGRRIHAIRLPRSVLMLGARIDRQLRGAKAKLTPDRVAYMCHPDWSIDPARRPPAQLWQPAIPTPDGLTETVAWYRAHRHI